MSATLSLPARLYHVARMLAALAGPPVARWSPRPPVPAATPTRYDLGRGIALWRLPVGLVRIRTRHRALPPDLAGIDDRLRFPVMMADRQITGWLDCTAWLIDHPERRILVDTGEGAGFGTAPYFGQAPAATQRIYPRILDATAAPGHDLTAALAATGRRPDEIDLCVLTHTHSDHIGQLEALPPGVPLLVAPEELVPAPRSGRLLTRLPRDGRVRTTERGRSHPVFGPVMPLTTAGDVVVVATPGHTAGHQSVVIDLGDRQVVLAGDAAFDDDQVAQNVIPGIVEDRAATLATYDRLRRARAQKPTLTLFTHDPANAAKLATFTGAAALSPPAAAPIR